MPKGLGCATEPGKSWLFSSLIKNAGVHSLPLLQPMPRSALLTGRKGSYLEGLRMGWGEQKQYLDLVTQPLESLDARGCSEDEESN